MERYKLSSHRLRKQRLIFAVQCIFGVLIVGLLAVFGLLFHLNLPTAGLLFLLSVVIVAFFSGFWQATIVSVAALLCQWYYFVPPIYTWHISAPGNCVDLIVFECAALIVSRLSAKEEMHARNAERQRGDMEKLYELSRKTLLLDLHKTPGPKLLELIIEVFSVEAIAIFDADLKSFDSWGNWPIDAKELARNTYHFESNQDDSEFGLSRRVLQLGAIPIGALLLRGDLSPLTVDAIASLISITFDRYRSFANESRAEAAHQSEQLRASVLDGLAHAFKTPLTAIRTASSGLLAVGALSPTHADLAALIEEQSELLNQLATRLLQTARLDAEHLDVKKERVMVAEIVEEVAQEQSGLLGDHDLVVTISDRTLATRGDRELLASIVRQFVDNAVKYSYPGTRIEVSAEESASEILIAVHNQGAPIQLKDRERIFDRFYRCPESVHKAPGTGIGLSIAKKVAEAHGGHVWVISDKQEGTTFFLSIRGLKGGTIE